MEFNGWNQIVGPYNIFVKSQRAAVMPGEENYLKTRCLFVTNTGKISAKGDVAFDHEKVYEREQISSCAGSTRPST